MTALDPKRIYTFAGNDEDGRMRTIYVESASPAAADKAAKQRLKNARMLSVKAKAGKEGV